jgi:hypothetical protein
MDASIRAIHDRMVAAYRAGDQNGVVEAALDYAIASRDSYDAGDNIAGQLLATTMINSAIFLTARSVVDYLADIVESARDAGWDEAVEEMNRKKGGGRQ